MKKFLSFLFSIFYLLSSTSVYAADPNPGPAGRQQLVELFTRIINLSVEAAFMILLLMLIYAGIRYLTSGGDPKSIEAASSTITWSLLGIVFMAIAWLLLRLIADFTGVDVTKFCIGFDPCR